MVEEHVVEWTKQWERRGEQQGERRGIEKGEATLLLRLLERKFGPLDAATRQGIATADADTLLTWGERLLIAESLAEVFDNS